MIEFHYQNDFTCLDEFAYSSWLHAVSLSEQKTIGDLSYVFCSDEYLLDVNKQFLQHDTFTDIITFDYSADDLLHGEIYISTDRVADNAAFYKVSFLDELHRVMAHGLLHLIGYGDKTEAESEAMRALEQGKMNMFHVKQ